MLGPRPNISPQLPQDWFPYSGTLISLLRHGGRSGMLSNGKVDVVDHDVDIMVGTTNEAEWRLGKMQHVNLGYVLLGA